MSWLEVETKIKVDNLQDIRKKIKKIASLKGNIKKSDFYFRYKATGNYPKKAFRIRKEKNHYIINFKKHLKEKYSKDIVVKEEFEFIIKNKADLDNFLLLLKDVGFKKWAEKKKTTEKYIYNKDKRTTIELNHVKHLGYWIEIENLCKKNEIAKAKKSIRDVMKALDIKQKQINNKGYTKMLHEIGKTE